jgi:hypothetical protein
MGEKLNNFDKKLKVDRHYTKEEIDFIRSNYSKLTELKTSHLKTFINKDVRIASELAIIKHKQELEVIS